MYMSFSEFITSLYSNPVLAITVVLTLGVILVNGFTDAPNAIATVISTRAMRPRPAILMAAVLNFAGVFFMTMVNSKVASTIYNIADFGNDPRKSSLALCAALFAIVVWAVAAWRFGIPTSESHALVAGIVGASVAFHGSFSGINGMEFAKVGLGLVFSTGLGFGMGYVSVKLVELICRNMDRRETMPFFKGAQIFGAGAMAFMHGAQDGQKFIGVFLLGVYLAKGTGAEEFTIPFWLIVLCSVVMGLGTSIGGMKIIKAVGLDMVRLEKYQGFAADTAAAGCLLISSLTGIPVSTTHTKTTAIMGVGAARRMSYVNWNVAKDMVVTWLATFPGCGLIGYLMTLLFKRLFL
ncbi:MAG: inorganic phosphate transporter [Clostridiales bacterium]|nr:inorganic phosphate transporter [Clostridiales bacterium]